MNATQLASIEVVPVEKTCTEVLRSLCSTNLFVDFFPQKTRPENRCSASRRRVELSARRPRSIVNPTRSLRGFPRSQGSLGSREEESTSPPMRRGCFDHGSALVWGTDVEPLAPARPIRGLSAARKLTISILLAGLTWAGSTGAG